MGDFIREAFKSSGIDEKMENVIAETILKQWNDEFGNKSRTIPSVAPQNIDSVKSAFKNAGMMRLITEQLGRRLERKYEEKLQKYKDNEEKNIEEKIEKLKMEYKRNLEFAQLQHEEKLRKKEEEFRRKEEILKEENRLEFEKRHLELERAWCDIEASKKDLRIEKEHLEAARANFSLKMSNENLVLQRQKDELVKENNFLKEREKELDDKIKTAVMEAKQKERDWIIGKVKEWNIKEAKLIEKCEVLHGKVRQSSKLQSTINEQASTVRVLQGDIANLRERLNESETKLEQAQQRIRDCSDYESLFEENKRLKEELLSKSKDEIISMKEVELENLRKRLKLVEETADLRIKELKLRLKVSTDRLYETVDMCKNNHLISKGSSSEMKERGSLRNLIKARQSSPVPTESNTSPSGNSSSFDRTLRDRLKNIDQLSRQLDVSVAEYRSRQFKDNVTPVSNQQLDFIVKNGNLSAPQPLMTSTPKFKRKSQRRFSSEAEAPFSVNRHVKEVQNGIVDPNAVLKLRRDSFGGTCKDGKGLSKRSLFFGHRSFKGNASESSGEEVDGSIHHCTSIVKEKGEIPSNDTPAEEIQPNSQSNNSILDEGENPVVDTVEVQETGSDSGW